MCTKSSKEIIGEVESLYREVSGLRFPYEGSRYLLREVSESYQDLIPDLDMYFSTIAGYCSWGERILNWRPEKMREVRERLAPSFFERYPQYEPLKDAISEVKTPDLFAQLTLHKRMRTELLELFEKLNVE